MPIAFPEICVFALLKNKPTVNCGVTNETSFWFLSSCINSFGFVIVLFAGTTFGLIITFIIILITAWWSSESTEILLSKNGYNFDAMNYEERFENVKKENLEKVKTLEISKNGIGWPAKVMFIYPFYFVYLLLIYLVMNLISNRK